MKKMFKRIFALICILTLAIGSSPASAASWQEITIPGVYTRYLFVDPFKPEGDLHLNFYFTDYSGLNTGEFSIYAINEYGTSQTIYYEPLYFYGLDNFRAVVLNIPYSVVRNKSVYIRMTFTEPVIIKGNILYYGD
ncbi:MAG TPA: hypothetical protein PK304_04810 [Mobilitalea sp.]|nr:hypothetical protein [Mobilitalea sp.]